MKAKKVLNMLRKWLNSQKEKGEYKVRISVLLNLLDFLESD